MAKLLQLLPTLALVTLALSGLEQVPVSRDDCVANARPLQLHCLCSEVHSAPSTGQSDHPFDDLHRRPTLSMMSTPLKSTPSRMQ